MKKKFEKLWLFLKNTIDYDEANIAIANCPDDWSLCSMVISAWYKSNQRFVVIQMDKKETIKIRDALSAVINDMVYNKTNSADTKNRAAD